MKSAKKAKKNGRAPPVILMCKISMSDEVEFYDAFVSENVAVNWAKK